MSKYTDNLTAIAQAAENASMYPHLSKRLNAHTGAVLKKLMNVLSYADAYGKGGLDGGQPTSKSNERGDEFMLTFKYACANWGGSADTWSHNMYFLAALGLLYPHKPDRNKDEYNTPQQRYSIERAKSQGKSHPATWWSMPRYGKDTLRIAEKRAEKLKGVSITRFNKDACRDILGAATANLAFGQGDGMTEETKAIRESIQGKALEQIQQRGYTRIKDITVAAALDLTGGAYDLRMIQKVEYTWRNYWPTFKKEHGLQSKAPTKEQRGRYGLTDKKYIITRTEETSQE